MNSSPSDVLYSIFTDPDAEDRLRRFERASSLCTEPVDLNEFAPGPDDPRRLAILAELIRLDLEFAFEKGESSRRTLNEYRRLYPELDSDPELLASIAFEETRLQTRWENSAINSNPAQPLPLSTAELSAGVDSPFEISLTSSFTETPSTAFQRIPKSDLARDTMVMFQSLRREHPDMAENLADAILAMPELGDQFLDFQLDSLLGRGAFGRVFLARQASLASRKVVLKIVAVDLERDESQTLARLHHTNIVPIHSIHCQNSLFAICMPYLGNHTLDHVIRIRASLELPARPRSAWLKSGRKLSAAWHSNRSLKTDSNNSANQTDEVVPTRGLVKLARRLSEIEEILRVVNKLTRGLEYAHKRGFTHGDLKPANILLADDGEPKLLDFNLARKLRNHGGLAADRLGGTLPYMAPEQLVAISSGAKPPPDPRSDIYSLGVILHELLVGQWPFDCPAGPIEAAAPLLLYQRKNKPIALRERNPDISPAVEAIVRKCLEPDLDQRYQSVRQLRRDLSRHLHNWPLRHAKNPSLAERAGKWSKRHPHSLLATFVVGLTIAASVLTAWFGWTTWACSQGRMELEALRQDLDEIRPIALEMGSSESAIARMILLDPDRSEMTPGIFDNWWNRQKLAYLPAEEQAEARRMIGSFWGHKALAVYLLAKKLPQNQEFVRNRFLGSAITLNKRAIEGFGADAPKELALRAERWQQANSTWPSLPDLGTDFDPKDAYWRGLEALTLGRRYDAWVLARKAAEEAKNGAPEGVWSLALLGISALELGHREESIAVFTHCLNVLSNSQSLSLKYRRGLALLDQAQVFEQQGRLELKKQAATVALADFQAVIDSGLSDSSLLASKAQALMMLEQYQESLTHLEQAGNGAQPRVGVNLLKAICLDELDRAREAAELRLEAQQLEPVDEQDRLFLALSRIDPEVALKDLDAVLATNPQCIYAWLLKARIHLRLARRPQAQIACQKVLNIDPNHREALAIQRELSLPPPPQKRH